MEKLKDLEPVIKAAMGGDVEARALLVAHPEIEKQLARVARAAEAEFKVDRDEISEVLLVKLFNRIETLNKPENFLPWCRSIARHHCLNVNRHLLIAKRYEELVKEDQSRFGRWHGEPLALSHDPSTPEEELIEKEEEQIFSERERMIKKRIREAAKKATSSLPESLVKAWAEGKTVKAMSEETGIPMATVYRMLARVQKEILREAISEIETIRDRMQSSRSTIEYEKGITRLILEGLQSE